MAQLTKQDLRDQCEKLGLKKSGTRAELEARVAAAQNGEGKPGDVEPQPFVGVIVSKQYTEKGKLEPGMIPHGVAQEEIPVLLEKALKVARRELELD